MIISVKWDKNYSNGLDHLDVLLRPIGKLLNGLADEKSKVGVAAEV